ncbi:MAG: glutamine--tRNA ligase/YqeY domain fusion protein [Bacteroidales bacterium]|jgi:glutaminyl-tRNA synthetase|nr:glutamine--tRNA ligase/YqeY domain fusion protein [Bacteroidales bacterium]
MSNENEEPVKSELKTNFIYQEIEQDLAAGKNGGAVLTRFPPEPNGYLHIGHAKSLCLNFGIARDFKGGCNLRFDDTNPVKEDVEYVDSIKEDINWLGFQWVGEPKYASDYFDQLYEWAIKLIKAGKAYVDHQTAEQIAAQKGTPTVPGQASPYRNTSVEENLKEFEKMRAGEYAEGECVLRAKIDMASPNMHMRDPLMYRILHRSHHRTGDKWCIYPMYDFAHGQSDFIEGITHSICTLEFEVHRPLYDWFLDQILEGEPTPERRNRQIEFARLNLNYTVMSKRKLLQLVKEGIVAGWDDPRMPTICGLRRRGYTPKSVRDFAEKVGIAKRENVIDFALLESCAREDLNKIAPRVFAVLDPVKVVIDNYPEGKVEMMKSVVNPEDESMGTREVPFTRELYIERDDFMENPPKKYFRLAPGQEVRLKSAYIIKCESVEKDAEGNITTIHVTYDEHSKSGEAGSERKVKGTIHWVSVSNCIDAEVRVYDRLFNDPEPGGHEEEGHDFKEYLNPQSLTVIKNAKLEPSLASVKPLDHFQFQRLGYFNVDPDSKPGKLIFNKTVGLKDSWAKMK